MPLGAPTKGVMREHASQKGPQKDSPKCLVEDSYKGSLKESSKGFQSG